MGFEVPRMCNAPFTGGCKVDSGGSGMSGDGTGLDCGLEENSEVIRRLAVDELG